MTKIPEYEVGGARLDDLFSRAMATASAIHLVEALQDDTLWRDSCTIAEGIQDVADALGWHSAGLVGHMLFGDTLGNTPLDDWTNEQLLEVLRLIAGGVTEHPGNQAGGDVTAHAIYIALHTLEGGLTDESALRVLDEVIRITSRFLYTKEGPGRALHPRVRATMDAIWAAASWVGNVPLEESAEPEIEHA